MPLIPTGTVRAAFEGDETGELDMRLAEALRELNVPSHRLGLIERLLEAFDVFEADDRRAKVGLAAIVAAFDRGSTGLPLERRFEEEVDDLLTLIEAVERSETDDSEYDVGIETDAVVELFRRAAIDGEGRASPFVGSMEDDAPLVYQHGTLYLHQTAAMEEVLADRFAERLMVAPPSRELAADGGRRSFDAVEHVLETWPFEWETANDREDKRDALETLVDGRIGILTGRAGTGKTTLVFALLRALVERGDVSPESIALAAPTGKAAARLREAIDEQQDELSETYDTLPIVEALSWSRREGDDGLDAPRTLHRLLEYSPYRRRFKRHEGRPLEADLVVVDEASMIDLELMEALTSALDEDTQLLLVGDSGQLPSVRAGAVFHDLSRPSEVPKRVASRIVELERVYRGDDEEEIPENAVESQVGRDEVNQAIRDSDGESSVSVGSPDETHTSDDSEVGWPLLELDEGVANRTGAWFVSSKTADSDDASESSPIEEDDPDGDRLEAFLEAWWTEHYGYLADPDDTLHLRDETFFDHADEATETTFESSEDGTGAHEVLTQLFDRLERAQLLSLTRRRSRGARTIDDEMHDRYAREHGLDDPNRFERGEPVIVTKNDYEAGVFNGQQGIVLYTRRPDEQSDSSDEDAKKRVVFRDGDDFRDVHLQRIKDTLDHAYALTVHKAQGSEYEHVGLLLPKWIERLADSDEEHATDAPEKPARLHPLVTREMIYTAVTRAETSVVVFGHPQTLQDGVGESEDRYSGVARRLEERL
jgi:exodeoxyribonuclease V alpha subunit